jgi:site-specific recombinase XerD
MLNDLFRIGAAWRSRPLQQSPFCRELEEFAGWLKDGHYTTVILRQHLFRLDRTLRRMEGAAVGVTYTAAQLQAAFGRQRKPTSRLIGYRGTQRAYQRFLRSQERLEETTGDCRFADLRQRYERYLLEVRGFSRSTLAHHRTTVAEFLERGLRPRQRLRTLTGTDVERFIGVRSTEMTRQSLQHTVAALRAFLRWCHDLGETSARLDVIDTPRTYRGELPPRALEWPAVQALLRSIDRDSPSGERDYAILHLMAHYGLRPSEIALMRLDSIDWASNTLRVEQRKTQSDLLLPLAPATVKALRRYLRRDRDRRQDAGNQTVLFLRERCPIGPLKNTGVYEIFAKRLKESGQDPTRYSAYSLRHAFAMRLLTRGVGVKAIGDVLGHRDLESTCVYLRLDIDALRDVALEVPAIRRANVGGRHA